jgi:sugar diacid utilization regulator
VRGDLLRDLLTGADRDPANVRERARFLGADLDQAHAVVVAEPDGDRDRAAQAAAHLAASCHGFSTVHHSRVVVILPGLAPGEAARKVTDRLTHALGTAPTTGAAGPATGVPAIVAAHAEASRVLEGLRALGRTGEAAESGELGFVGLLLGDRRDVAPFVESVLGPVLEYDAQRGTALVETLEAYFRNGRNLARTRADLHVHVNTVTQRLDRVGRLLGEHWQEPESQLEIQLALRLNRLRRGPA